MGDSLLIRIIKIGVIVGIASIRLEGLPILGNIPFLLIISLTPSILSLFDLFFWLAIFLTTMLWGVITFFWVRGSLATKIYCGIITSVLWFIVNWFSSVIALVNQ